MTNPLLAQFIPEARDLIQTSATGLLKLEDNPQDAAVVNEVFRAVHTLKGSSGLFEVVALTKLVHAAEDILGAIRVDELALNSEIVDRLLESLDRVGEWIDHLERHETLPAEADGISRGMVNGLRACAVSEPAAKAVEADAKAAAPAERPAIAWLGAFTQAQRTHAFRQLLAGDTVLAVRYVPDEGCFYNGTDPLGTALQLPDLLGLDAKPREPFPPLAEFDPYRCILELQMLTAAPKAEVEYLFRYDIEQIEIETVALGDLVRLVGNPDASPVWSDFTESAYGHLAAGDLTAMRSACGVLLHLMGPASRPASALRWLDAGLDAGLTDAALLTALVDAVSSGSFSVPRAGGETPLPPVAAVAAASPVESTQALALPGGTQGAVALRILEAQLRSLSMAGDPAHRLGAVGATLLNLLSSLGRGDRCAPLQAALDAAAREASAAPVIAFIEALMPSSAKARDAVEAMPAPGSAAAPQSGGTSTQGGETASAPPAASTATKTLKVDQAKIDRLMNLIGELVVSKNSLPFLARKAEDVYGSREMGRDIKEQYAVIDRLAQEMQGAIMQVRMLPVSEVFARFPRLVRDLSRKLGKRIALTIEGGDTAADKTIVEALGDPLLHIVRNSLDHGIETADERTRAGKRPEAQIGLKAYQEADSVVIEVSDDGRGIDAAKIRKAAVAKGVIDAATAERLSDQEAVNLIYRPGFSTAATVSDLSGRGVGMDVVLTTVQGLGGSVEVTTQLGSGTLTRVTLPLSMAVARVMVVEVADNLYGIPMDMIVETVRVPRSSIRTIKRSEAFILRDAVIPLVRMQTLLRIADASRAETEIVEEAVLVCRVNGHQIGLVIDDFREGLDVILKPLEGVLARIQGYSGTTLLGDGRVLLVLNLKELL